MASLFPQRSSRRRLCGQPARSGQRRRGATPGSACAKTSSPFSAAACSSSRAALLPWPVFSQSYEDQNLDLWRHAAQRAALARHRYARAAIFSHAFFGGRISAHGLVASAVALVIGVTYGAVAGYFGGKTDALMMRIVDIIYALPFTIFVILLMVFQGSDGETGLMVSPVPFIIGDTRGVGKSSCSSPPSARSNGSRWRASSAARFFR